LHFDDGKLTQVKIVRDIEGGKVVVCEITRLRDLLFLRDVFPMVLSRIGCEQKKDIVGEGGINAIN
jgi:hypothetical protein